MTLRTTRSAVAAALLLGVIPGRLVGTAALQTQRSTASLIAAYGEWVHGARSDLDLTVVDLDAARLELARLNPELLPAQPGLSPEEIRESHRRLLTTFALEVAAIGAQRHALAAARLIEWACQYVRSHTPVNEFDRAWELAALAALEGGIDSDGLRTHLAHLHGAFSEDPRVLLAYGIAEEQFNAPAETLARSLVEVELGRTHQEVIKSDAESTRAAERAISRFRDALRDPAIHVEAALRLGHVQLMLHHYDVALAAWNDLAEAPSDPSLIYLARLFRGLAYEGLHRDEDAQVAYASAAALSPGAHSASVRLAALSFRTGHAAESSRIVERLLADDDPRRDPWWSYYAGDWRFWYPRIERVRTFLK